MTSTMRKTVGRPKDEGLPARRRQEILDAAAHFFARLGYPNSDLRILADELGVAKGTLYRYFPSKKDLFAATVENCVCQLKAEVDEAVTQVGPPLAKIEQAVRAYFRFFDQHPYVVELFIQERAEFRAGEKQAYFEQRRENLGPWKELFAELSASGKIRNVPVDRAIEVASNLLYGTMFTKYFSGQEETLESKTNDVLDTLFNGLMLKEITSEDLVDETRKEI